MQTNFVTIDGVKYKVFDNVTIFPGTDRETVIDRVAEQRLNDKIEAEIQAENYPHVRAIDETFGYFVPQEVADTNDERTIRESLEDVWESMRL